MIKHINLIALLLFCFAQACDANDGYFFDESKLNNNQKELFKNIKNSIDDWGGESEKHQESLAMIETLSKENPKFLPTYVERSRYLIMMGAIQQGSWIENNKKALLILADIQEKDPEYAKSYVLAAHIFTNLKDYDSAKKSLIMAKKIQLKRPLVLFKLVYVAHRTRTT